MYDTNPPAHMALALEQLGVVEATPKSKHAPVQLPKEKPKFEFRMPVLDENGEPNF